MQAPQRSRSDLNRHLRGAQGRSPLEFLRMGHTVLIEINCKPGKGAEFVALLSAALVDT